MHNFSTTSADKEPVLSNNMSLIETAYNNEAYHYWVSAADMEDTNDTASPTYRTGDITTGVPHHWRFADGVTSSVGFYIKRHGEWRDGVLSLVPHYSSSATGNAFRWRVSVVPTANLANPSVTLVGLTKNGPTVANAITTVDLSDSTLAPTSQVNSEHIGVYITIGRSGANAADTNTGVLWLYGVDLVYKESRRVVGGKA